VASVGRRPRSAGRGRLSCGITDGSLLMPATRSLEQLKDLGSGRPAPDEIACLYHKAFSEFGVSALWSRKPIQTPTITQALAIADALRTEGDLRARALAVEIEAKCRAAL
jgi:hypothetical protein